ncbi:uncharacterized protein BXZ73DRAFT_98375 [Epithele typhae]|uniref:uncharacterized protein n=1 Tax=Epithele typhae TaxID=378194 RepID=UPI002008A492|nr:uncharacterized protein BXZ73DRAFT_98375 [Epithele typhae]KAH9941163.1 hypothetical protein BXZ73DRAFT_98375 [Epithele typhae]
MPNPTGKNQYYNGKRPPDEELEKALRGYSKELLPQPRQVERLAEDLKYHISVATLKKHLKAFDIPSARKPIPHADAVAHVQEFVATDVHRRNGPVEIRHRIAQTGIIIPRDTKKIKRGKLDSPGFMAQLHVDGHEKLSALALAMGGVGLEIYGMRETNGPFMQAVVVPNARYNVAVAHLYLDLVEKLGHFPRQITADGGSETGLLRSVHVALRETFAPELREIPFQQLPSTRNIPIENMWSRWLKADGDNLKTIILQGRGNGLFLHGHPVHTNLFQWLWSKVVQKVMDEFREGWNRHRIRKQKGKLGHRMHSNDVIATPTKYGLEDHRVGVTDMSVIQALRACLPQSRHDALRFVDDEFDVAAWEVYSEIGEPPLTVLSGWEVFGRMAARLERMYDDHVGFE